MKIAFILRCAEAPFLRYVIRQPVSLIGRSSQCNFVLDEPSISRRHAEIRIKEATLHVTDLQSHNGTFVDDVRIEACSLSPGQTVRFGTVAFAVAFEDPGVVQASAEEETHDSPPEVHGSGLLLQHLSNAQRNVFDLLVTGLSEKAISRRLNLSSHTVHTHTKNIFQIFAVHSRAQLLATLLKPKSGGL